MSSMIGALFPTLPHILDFDRKYNSPPPIFTSTIRVFAGRRFLAQVLEFSEPQRHA